MQQDSILIFDADGVLIEPWGFAQALADDYGILPEATAEFFAGPFQRCLLGEADVAKELAPFLPRWGWQDSVESLINLWLESEDQPRAEVFELVRKYRADGVSCAVASNQESRRARHLSSHLFNGLADRLYFSCDLAAKKPSSDFYEKITHDLGVDPASIHFWDDSPAHVAGANQYGWNAYHYEGIETILEVL